MHPYQKCNGCIGVQNSRGSQVYLVSVPSSLHSTGVQNSRGSYILGPKMKDTIFWQGVQNSRGSRLFRGAK